MDRIIYSGSGIYREELSRFKNDSNDESKGSEDIMSRSIFKKISGDGIGAIYKKIAKTEEDFVMVERPKTVKSQSRQSVCDRLDRFRNGSLGELKRYTDLVDAFLQRKGRDNGRSCLEKEITKEENLLSEVKSKKSEAARFFNNCVRGESNEWRDDPNAIINARTTLNSFKEATDLLEGQLASDLELLEKTNRRYLLSQNTLLRPQHIEVLKEFDRLKGVDRSLYSQKYFRKLEMIESALFDFFLSLMRLGATRCENYRRGKEYLQKVENQTLEVEVLAKGWNVQKIRK